MSSGFDNKRGSSIVDILFILIVVVVIGLVFFFVKLSFDDVTTDLVASGDLGVEGTAILQDANSGYTSWSDYAIGFIFFGLIMGIMITSYFVGSHPVFFVISLILFIFVVFIGASASNFFQEVVADADLLAVQSSYPITMFIVENLVLLLIATFVLMCVVLYGKSGSGSGGGDF